MKGCLLFAAVLLTGIALMIAAGIHELFIEPNTTVRRVLGISGISLVFVAIYGAAGRAFYKRFRRQPEPPQDAD